MKIILLLSLFLNLAFCEIVVMVSYKNKLIKVTKKEIADLYLKKTNKIQGIIVIPIDNKLSYGEFCKTIIRKTPKQLRAYWAREIFRGNKLPPKRLTNSQIKKHIKNNAKVISYASSKLTGKVVLTISK